MGTVDSKLNGDKGEMDMADPIRGEIWLADLGPGRGHEQFGQRPVLVVSDDDFNAGLAACSYPATSASSPSKSMPFM